ncbi:hypothetical protein, partial [Carboxydocella sp. ULO1]
MKKIYSKGLIFQILVLIGMVLLITSVLSFFILWEINQTQKVLLEQQKSNLNKILEIVISKTIPLYEFKKTNFKIIGKKQKKINITVPKISISKPFGLEIKKVIDSISNN